METGYQLTNGYDWSQLEFMMGVISRYFLDLELSKRRMKKNDWTDFLNMAYVGPTRKYWTQDKQWNQYAEAANLSSYLFTIG